MESSQSAKLFTEAQTYFPGGVNSPVRAFRSVGGTPIFITKGDGSFVWDADNNQFLDFCGSWGPLILGHNHPAIRNAVVEAAQNGMSFGAPTIQENILAKLIISNHPFLEKIRFVSSGTEAVMSAIRLARGFTNRTKIVKFEGCYHGHTDYLLVKAGSGLVTFGETSSAGVPEAFARETLVLPLNDRVALQKVFNEFGHDIACVIIEPIPANNGLLLQTKAFLRFLRQICDQYGSLLLFDEVISGFRVGFGGAAQLYGIKPDILTFGKIIGGGLPVGAYGASAEIMKKISPDGPVYQAGTLSGNPIAMSAGIAQLTELLQKGFYRTLTKKTTKMVRKIREGILKANLPVRVFQVGSIFWISFSDNKKVMAAHEIDGESMRYFKVLHHFLLISGIYFGPSGYEVGFVSAAHTEEQLRVAADKIVEGLKLAFKN